MEGALYETLLLLNTAGNPDNTASFHNNLLAILIKLIIVAQRRSTRLTSRWQKNCDRLRQVFDFLTYLLWF